MELPVLSDFDEKQRDFFMSDPIRNERLEVFGVRYQVWQVILQSVDRLGYVKATQVQLAIRSGVTERAMRSHFAAFKQAGMIEKRRDSSGRMRFYVCPEHYWNRKNVVVNKELKSRQANVSKRRRERQADLDQRKRSANITGSVDGGKVA